MYALLVCEDADEEAILSLVLQRVGLAVTSAASLDRALENWGRRTVELVVWALPGHFRPEEIGRLRERTDALVVAISPATGEECLCCLYEAGADLVLTRPYSVRLLIHQLRSLSRRGRGSHLLSIPPLSFGGLTLDPATRTVKVRDGSLRRLTQLEFRLLHTLPSRLSIAEAWEK